LSTSHRSKKELLENKGDGSVFEAKFGKIPPPPKRAFERFIQFGFV